MRVTRYDLTTPKPGVSFTCAIVADLHDHPFGRILEILKAEKPDMILIPGDLTESLEDEWQPERFHRPGLDLLWEAVKIAPTFYSFGNHESGACHKNLRNAAHLAPGKGRVHPSWKEIIRESGAILVDEDWVTFRGITIGGLGSGLLNPGRVPVYDWIEAYARQPSYKLLLCHHPEYFDRYLRSYDIDLFVSGHAHGGQWRVFGRGVYAPDQPLFPKYTSGVHEGRLVISRGVVNTVKPIPRFFNPCEVVVVRVQSKERR